MKIRALITEWNQTKKKMEGKERNEWMMIRWGSFFLHFVEKKKASFPFSNFWVFFCPLVLLRPSPFHRSADERVPARRGCSSRAVYSDVGMPDPFQTGTEKLGNVEEKLGKTGSYFCRFSNGLELRKSMKARRQFPCCWLWKNYF